MIEISSIYGVNFLYLKEEKGRWGIEYDDLSVCEFVTVTSSQETLSPPI